MLVARALLALAIIAAPKQTALVRTTVASLPACVQRVLEPQLRGVVVTNEWILGKPYDGFATEDGVIILTITPKDSLRLELMHELGHEVDDRIGGTTPEFRRALKEDFATISRPQRRELAYYRTPAEAWAELFAERYDSNYEADGEDGIEVLVLARRVLNEQMNRLERCR